MPLRVMISSVRRGLAAERDALRPVITILNYTPIRFEDFTAQPVPSRAVCVDAVTGSDIYLLLLGQYYGERTLDTGLAPTAEEWTVARQLGKPIIVFRQVSTEPEPDQQTFIAEVESYSTGVFRDSFASTAELLEKLKPALEAAAALIQPLRPRQLDQPIEIAWRDDDRGWVGGGGTILETHLVPVGSGDRIRAGDLQGLSRRVARIARDTGLFEERDPLDVAIAEGQIEVRIDRRSSHEDRGIRIRTDQSVVVWRTLSSEMGATIYDEADIPKLIAGDLRTATQLGVISTEEAVIALGLNRIDMLARRTGPNSWEHPFFGRGNGGVRIEPAEAVRCRSRGSGDRRRAGDTPLAPTSWLGRVAPLPPAEQYSYGLDGTFDSSAGTSTRNYSIA